MIFFDFYWLSVIFRDFPWHDFPWLSVTFRDSPWLSVTFRDFSWRPPGRAQKSTMYRLKRVRDFSWRRFFRFFVTFRDADLAHIWPQIWPHRAPRFFRFFMFLGDFSLFFVIFINFNDFPWFFIIFNDFPWLSVIMLLNPVVAPSMLAHWPWRRSWRGEKGKGGRERCKFLFYGCGAEYLFKK